MTFDDNKFHWRIQGIHLSRSNFLQIIFLTYVLVNERGLEFVADPGFAKGGGTNSKSRSPKLLLPPANEVGER